MRPQRQTRRTITIDMPAELIAWLDQQAANALLSRSGFLRQLILSAIQEAAKG